MAISRETLRIARELRVTISGIVDDDTRALVRAWARAWDQIVAEWRAAASEIAALDRPPTWWEVMRMDRAQNALRAAQSELDKLADRARVRVSNSAGDVVELTREFEARQIASQFPRQAGPRAELVVRFDRVNPDALRAIVERTTRQITAYTRPLSDEATEAMLRALVQAIPQGLSPREAARRMVRSVEGRFNGGLTRALTISRTEVLDAYRAAAFVQQQANADVLAGWIWHATLDNKTCISCVAQHGTLHPMDEGGPEDHQNGRCARMPKTKSWAELGFSGIDEPADRIRSGAAWFAAQPERTQLAIAGPGRLDALKSGRATLADMTSKRSTAGWRDSFVPTPVGRLAA